MSKLPFLGGFAVLSACSQPKTVEEEVRQAVSISRWLFEGQEMDGGGRIESVLGDGRVIIFSFADLPNDTSTDSEALAQFYRELVCQRESTQRLFAKGVSIRFSGALADQTPLPTVTIDRC